MKNKTRIILWIITIFVSFGCSTYVDKIDVNNPNGNNSTNTNTNTTSNFTIIISGQLTDNFTMDWKVGLATKDALDNYLVFVYATVKSNGTFSFTNITNNLGNRHIIAFEDTNFNSIYDVGEPLADDKPEINIQNSDISGISIIIPSFTQIEITGEVDGNIYNLPIGLIFKNTNTYTYLFTTPNTNETFDYTNTISISGTNGYEVMYYIDDNTNGKWDGDFGVGLYESIGYMFEYFTVHANTDVNVGLRGKVMHGILTGNATNDFDSFILIGDYYKRYTPIINKSNYIAKYYIPQSISNSNDIINYCQSSGNNGHAIMVMNNEGSILINPVVVQFKGVPYTNTNGIIIATNNKVNTNKIDFIVNKYYLTGVVEGSNATEFDLAVITNYNDITKQYYFETRNNNYTWTNYRFGSADTAATLYAFKDIDSDNEFELYNVGASLIFADEPGFEANITISNQIYVTNIFYMKKTIVNVSVVGSVSSYTHPKITFRADFNSYYWANDTWENTTISAYWETNDGLHIPRLRAFDDINNDGFYDDGCEQIISDQHFWFTYVETTNLTLTAN